jgi:recombination protein RecR
VNALDRLTTTLARLPGVGRRSAERMAVALLRDPEGLLRELSSALTEAARSVTTCASCGSLTPVDQQPCRLCTAPGREAGVLCVVEDPSDIVLVERSGGYHGRYHALMGKLSPMRGEGFRSLRVVELVARVEREGFREVILATSTDVEGDATASYVADRLKGRGVTVTRVALGLPARSGIAYADPVTIQRAIAGRRAFG